MVAAATSPRLRECVLDMDAGPPYLVGRLTPRLRASRRFAVSPTAAVSRSRNGTPPNQNAPATTIMPATTASATFHDRPAMAPRIGGEIASPRAWITRMLSAKALVRTEGWVTLARIVFDGPVLRKRKKTASEIQTHRSGEAGCASVLRIIRTTKNAETTIPAADTMKYAPDRYRRRKSPSQPPLRVAAMPATTVISPNRVFTVARSPACAASWR